MSSPRLLIALLAVLASTAQARAPGPADAVAAFYNWNIKSGTGGAPNPAEQAHIAPLVTSELHCVLSSAWRMMERYRVSYPDEKPPYVEGDLYSSSFEGPAAFEILNVKSSGKDRAVAVVRLTVDDVGPPSYWRDRVHVRFENGAWRVADFERNAGFAFGQAGSLLRNLHANVDAPVPAVGYPGAAHCRPVKRRADRAWRTKPA